MSGILSYSLGLNTAPMLAGFAAARSAIGGFKSVAAAAFTPLAGAAAAFLGVGSAALAFKKSIDAAAGMETLQTSFIVLLGSTQAAKTRMQELARFAADTPFELPQVASASRTLETLTKGALSTGRGLTLVGDVASGTGQSFNEVAVTIGRLYDGLQSGRPVGEAMQRLQELGAISGDTRAQIEALQSSGKKGDEVWSVAAGSLGKFSGMMKQQAGTWSGLMSTLQDNISAVFRAFGTPVMDALKPVLEGAVMLAERLAPLAAAAAERIVSAVRGIVTLFKSGELTTTVATALQIGFQEAVNFLIHASRGVTQAFLKSFSQIPEVLADGFRILVNTDFWSGLYDVLRGIASGFVSFLASALAPLVDKLVALLNEIPGIQIDWRAQELADAAADVTKELTGTGMEKMRQALEAPFVNAKARAADVLEAFNEGFSSGAVPFDTAALKAQLAGILGDAFTVSQEVTKGAGAEVRTGSTAANVSAKIAAPQKSFSDRLAQMGVFLGANGSPGAAKAQEDTARNTKDAAVSTKKSAEYLAQLIALYGREKAATF